MKYFEFKYAESIKGLVVNEGDALYYTSAEIDLNEMKRIAKNILKNELAVIEIKKIKEISFESFEALKPH